MYQSLIEQTSKDFVWLVVDDGSKDNTAEVLMRWKKEKKIDIEFYRQENGGKHRAHNLGVKMCNTDWFICVDSDDFLTKDAVDIFLAEILQIVDEIGIMFPKYEVRKEFSGHWFQRGEKVHVSDLYIKLNKITETALLYKAKYLKECLFPEYEGEKYLGEEIVYNELDRIGVMKVCDSKVYCYKYRDDGLTQNAFCHWKNSPIGMLALLSSRYNTILISDTRKTRKYVLLIKCIMNINALCMVSQKSIMKNTTNKYLSAFLYLPSVIFKKYRYGTYC